MKLTDLHSNRLELNITELLPALILRESTGFDSQFIPCKWIPGNCRLWMIQTRSSSCTFMIKSLIQHQKLCDLRKKCLTVGRCFTGIGSRLSEYKICAHEQSILFWLQIPISKNKNVIYYNLYTSIHKPVNCHNTNIPLTTLKWVLKKYLWKRTLYLGTRT